MKSIFWPYQAARLAAGALAFALLVPTSNAAVVPANPHTAPAIVKHGNDLGRENGATILNLTIWLNMHDQAGFYRQVQELYTPGSPSFHHWMTADQLRPYMPTDGEFAGVKQELAVHKIKVVSTDKANLVMQVSGRSADFEEAFGTEIHRVSYQGKISHISTTAPRLGGAATGLVYHVGGLGSVRMKPMFKRAVDPRTHKEFAGKPVTSGKRPDGQFYASQCFYAPETVSFSGVSDQDGTTPVSATYTGLTYGADPDNTSPPDLAPCGYSPQQVQGFYNMQPAYNAGFDGTGQTVVIVDAYDESSFIEADLALFSELYGLPAPSNSNFTIINPSGPGLNGQGSGWDTESDLDVEWSHSIASGANIAFVQAFSDEDENMQYALLYAAENKLGNSLSGSFGYEEGEEGPYASHLWNEVVAYGASQGIAMNFSSGDSGDEIADFGSPQVSNPSSSPYATAVGGTSIGVYTANGNAATTGWGNNQTLLEDGTGYVDDPPENYGFYAGSGGGTSVYFAKPKYQAGLPGSNRLVPDVSALADPFTGAEFIYTDSSSGEQYVSVIGGTSLASPIFAGMWAIVDQIYGSSLGQAAPYIATAAHEHSPLIQDVVGVTTPDNVTGSVTDPSGTTQYTAAQLSAPISQPAFTSALWEYADGVYLNLTFGTDTSLTLAPGWDNVTGYGTPNFKTIIDNVNPSDYPVNKK